MRKTRIRFIALLAVAAHLSAADRLYESAARKLDLIESRKAKRGSSIAFTAAEINAWARVKVPEVVPEGMRDEQVELGTNTGTGYALVDFLKMRQAKGASANWLIDKLIEGERPLKVSVRLESGDGRCIVHLTRVEIGKVSANQTVTAFLVNAFFKPLYPDAKIDEWFDLDYDMDRIELTPAGAKVWIKKVWIKR